MINSKEKQKKIIAFYSLLTLTPYAFYLTFFFSRSRSHSIEILCAKQIWMLKNNIHVSCNVHWIWTNGANGNPPNEWTGKKNWTLNKSEQSIVKFFEEWNRKINWLWFIWIKKSEIEDVQYNRRPKTEDNKFRHYNGMRSGCSWNKQLWRENR